MSVVHNTITKNGHFSPVYAITVRTVSWPHRGLCHSLPPQAGVSVLASVPRFKLTLYQCAPVLLHRAGKTERLSLFVGNNTWMFFFPIPTVQAATRGGETFVNRLGFCSFSFFLFFFSLHIYTGRCARLWLTHFHDAEAQYHRRLATSPSSSSS